jgi:hypothetical protein
MKEWHRTIALLILLVVAIGIIVWLHTGFEANSIQTLR